MVPEELPGGGDGGGVIVDDEVHRTGRPVHRRRTHGLCREGAQPAAGDHGGATHPEVGVLRGDDDVAQSGEGGVAGETPPGDDGHQRDLPTQARHGGEGRDIELHRRGDVGVAGASAAAFGEEDDGQPATARDIEQPVGLVVVARALGAGEDHVVVAHDDGAQQAGAGVDRPDTADETVGAGTVHQVIVAAPGALGGDREGPVLGETPGDDEVVEVLAGGAATSSVDLRHVLRVPVVEDAGMARGRFGDAGMGAGGGVGRGVRVAGDTGEYRECLPLLHEVTDSHQEAGGDVRRRGDAVVHLHRLEDAELGGTVRVERDDGAGERGAEECLPGGGGRVGGGGVGGGG